MRLNAIAPGVIAQEAARIGALVVHYSSDYVYSGVNDKPWLETDDPSPVNYYGYSKLEGDMAVARAAHRHLVLRTSWVYASRGKNFLLTMMRLFKEKKEISVVDDQMGAPTWARYIAQATACAVQKTLENEALSGTYNIVPSGVTSWYGFATGILEELKAKYGLGHGVNITPVATSQYPTAARRPAWSVLSVDKAEKAFGLYSPSWRGLMKLCVEEAMEREVNSG